VTSRLSSIVPVWLVVFAGILLASVFGRSIGYYTWLALLLSGAVLLTFVIQLALPSKDGLVQRMMASIGGSVALLAVATAVFLVVGG
jgi:hypothetical protein